MCKVSDKLTLCSCKTEDVTTLKHYWVLKRTFNRGMYIIGSIVPPADIGEDLNQYNISTLETLLNKGNAFDTQIQLENKDILELHFTVDTKSKDKDTGGYLCYAFKFKNGKWCPTEYDPFANDLMEVQAGKFKNPFQ